MSEQGETWADSLLGVASMAGAGAILVPLGIVCWQTYQWLTTGIWTEMGMDDWLLRSGRSLPVLFSDGSPPGNAILWLLDWHVGWWVFLFGMLTFLCVGGLAVFIAWLEDS